jgi:hypothetical protein
MDFSKVLSSLKKSFSPRKSVDFEEQGLHIELEPLTASDEVKILESLKDMGGSQYIEALKRHSLACSIKRLQIKQENELVDLDLSIPLIEYTDDTGNKKTQSTFLYMIDFLGQCPSTVVDLLFDAFTDMVQEAQNRVVKNAKFEKFVLSEKIPESNPDKFKQVIEKEDSYEGLDENERLQKKVNRELDQETAKMAHKLEEKEMETLKK